MRVSSLYAFVTRFILFFVFWREWYDLSMKIAIVILAIIIVGIGIYLLFFPLSDYRIKRNALEEVDNKIILKAQSLVRISDADRLAEDLRAYHLEKGLYPNTLIDFFKDTTYARTFVFSQDSIEGSLANFYYFVSPDKQRFLLLTSLTFPREELRKRSSQSVIRMAEELFSADCMGEMVYCVNEVASPTSSIY